MLKKEDVVYLKGFAILFIIYHNFFHCLNDAPGHNEFEFSQAYFFNLIRNLVDNPLDIAKQFFSFFGHYGVQVFIFLSGYGLSISYSKQPQTYFSFVKKRLLKIYPLLLGAVLIYVFPKIFYILFYKNDISLLISFIKSSLLKLTLFANVSPEEATAICGPWWFFSLIFQLYLLFPLLFRLKKNFLLLVIFFSWIIQLIVIEFSPSYMEYLRMNFIGHLPEFCLGLYFVKQKIEKVPLFVFLFSIFFFFLGCINQYFWVFSFFTIPLFAMYLFQFNKYNKIVMYFGNNSMYLFAVHGFLINSVASFANKSVLFSIIFSFIYLLISIFVAQILKFCLVRVNRKILKND